MNDTIIHELFEERDELAATQVHARKLKRRLK